MSALQLQVLDQVARSRSRGVLQIDLCNRLGIQPRNFFYISKSLEGRGLVLRTPLMLRDEVSQRAINTYVLHLTRYAPRRLTKGQRIEATEGPEQAQGGEGPPMPMGQLAGGKVNPTHVKAGGHGRRAAASFHSPHPGHLGLYL